jgi:hypothetical protein
MNIYMKLLILTDTLTNVFKIFKPQYIILNYKINLYSYKRIFNNFKLIIKSIWKQICIYIWFLLQNILLKKFQTIHIK